jgi:HEAT repeat protein
MGFDVENFGLGLLVGWGTAYGVYRARHLIAGTLRSVSQGAASAQNYATQSANSRYVNDLARLAEANHLAGRFVSLSKVLVEPRFIPPPPLAAPSEEEVTHSVFHVVPFIHDFPYLHAPYNFETLSIDDLGTGDRALALLGQPGSGRTTALMAIILRSLGKVRFQAPPDKVQQRLDAEEAALSDKQRAVRVKERVLMEQRAKERLAQEQGQSFDANADAQHKEALPLFNRLMPVYVHLADVNLRDTEFGKEIDPAEPLVRTVQRGVGRVTASTIPRNLYNRLSSGGVLVLVDGYDELPDAERAPALAWLNALMSAYPENFFIVTGPAVGYGALTRLGLTPVFMRPWSDGDYRTAADKWAANWPEIGGTRRNPAARPDEAAIGRAKASNRAFSPFEATLKIWANYANDSETPGVEGWLRAWFARHLPAEQGLTAAQPQLMQAAALQLDEGYLTRKRLEEMAGLTPTRDDEPEIEAAEEADGKKAKDKKEETSAQGKLVAALARSGVITRNYAGRYLFRHPHLASYLASLALTDAKAIQEKSGFPNWRQAIAYAALHTPMDEGVRVRLNAPSDLIGGGLFELANWLAYAPADVPWRGPYLKQIGTIFLSPSQYPLLRERAAAALVGTRDKSVARIFARALGAPEPSQRRLAALGLGALGETEGVRAMAPLLQDGDADVQIAAALALAAIGTEEALTTLIEALTEGEERLRQAAAESFAAIPDEGYPVLYDAIQDQDMMLRRAAVFGLRRVGTNWALIAIYRAFLEDEQWYVRSAAQLAFQELQYGTDKGPRGYPPADSFGWLAEWAARRGENVPPGEGANQVLLRALQEGEPDVKLYAAGSLGQLGAVNMAKPLYGVLRDRRAEVREAAYRALADLQLQMGQPLPAPV